MDKTKSKMSELWTKSMLIDRGWTEATIKKFYPKPYKTVRNPHYRNAPAMKLYIANKVMVVETTGAFKTFKESSKRRKVSAKKAVETKKEKLLREVRDIDISFNKIEYSKLVPMAIRHFNAWKEERYEDHYFLRASIDADKCFLDRITVNFIRHQLTKYDKLINSLYRRVGKTSAYRLLCERIFNHIAEVYPEIKAEAMQQLAAKINGTNNILTEDWFNYSNYSTKHPVKYPDSQKGSMYFGYFGFYELPCAIDGQGYFIGAKCS